MSAFCFVTLELPHWLTWVAWASGVVVSGLVITAGSSVLRRRRATDDDDDIPWEALLDLLKERYQGENGAAYVDSMSSEELFQALLSEIPRMKRQGPPGHGADEVDCLPAGAERRKSRRRWLNPVSVSFYLGLESKPRHGIVINRSSGGVAILVDRDIPPDETLFVRALEAPENVPVIQVKVRHSRRAGRMHLLGCQYCQDLPWNVKVWFG
ncbi:MAG: PilZ domain-containing protein [Gemmataceae bacterium]|nr:PilZ domain-containing protein [Gemmataceae bacterium]